MARLEILQRTNRRVQSLIQKFSQCVDKFEQTSRFTGPSVYFHHRTLEMLAEFDSPAAAITDKRFLELLYATLTAWGLHRMGSRGAKLNDFEKLKENLEKYRSQIETLRQFTIWSIPASGIQTTVSEIWKVVSGLEVGTGETRIVSGSKALHHILPNLVPPIDRQYTLRFFFGNTNVKGSGEEEFQAIYPLIYKIANARKPEIEVRLKSSSFMNTSITKVVDNAIVGFGLLYVGSSGKNEWRSSEVSEDDPPVPG